MAVVCLVSVRGSVVEIAPEKPDDSDNPQAAFLVYLPQDRVVGNLAFFYCARGDLKACLREVTMPEYQKPVPSRYVGQHFIDY